MSFTNHKLQITNYKQALSINDQKPKRYDLEDRTQSFARNCRDFINKTSRTIANIEYAKQLVRASGSVAANYIEANESLSKKDFVMRTKICRKEVKECRLWLSLVETNDELANIGQALSKEATELLKIFSAILENPK